MGEHKSIFFAESTPDGAPIDYRAAVTGALTLAPAGDARQALAEDYQRMVGDGLLLDDAESFDALLQRCQALALKVNAAVLGGRMTPCPDIQERVPTTACRMTTTGCDPMALTGFVAKHSGGMRGGTTQDSRQNVQ